MYGEFGEGGGPLDPASGAVGAAKASGFDWKKLSQVLMGMSKVVGGKPGSMMGGGYDQLFKILQQQQQPKPPQSPTQPALSSTGKESTATMDWVREYLAKAQLGGSGGPAAPGSSPEAP